MQTAKAHIPNAKPTRRFATRSGARSAPTNRTGSNAKAVVLVRSAKPAKAAATMPSRNDQPSRIILARKAKDHVQRHISKGSLLIAPLNATFIGKRAAKTVAIRAIRSFLDPHSASLETP